MIDTVDIGTDIRLLSSLVSLRASRIFRLLKAVNLKLETKKDEAQCCHRRSLRANLRCIAFKCFVQGRVSFSAFGVGIRTTFAMKSAKLQLPLWQIVQCWHTLRSLGSLGG